MKKSIFIFIFAISLLFTFLWQYFPLQDASDRLQSLPLQGDTYKGVAIPLASYEAVFLGQANVLKRFYYGSKYNFYLTVVDGTHQRNIVHDPYYCLRGDGWSIDEQTQFSLWNGNASLLRMSKGQQLREVLFWFTDGQQQFSSPLQYWLWTSLRRVTFGLYSNEPVLIFLESTQDETVDWRALIEELPDLKKI